MLLIISIIYLFKFQNLNKRLTSNEKITDFSEIFFITNEKAEKKLNGHIIYSKIKDQYIFIFGLLFDLIIFILSFF